ncbi:MAG: YdcH family protein [Acidobacteriaceae bacterium]
MEASSNGHSLVAARLQEEHRAYSERLESLQSISYLSAEQQIEETRLKKLKLQTKDQLNALGSVQS